MSVVLLMEVYKSKAGRYHRIPSLESNTGMGAAASGMGRA